MRERTVRHHVEEAILSGGDERSRAFVCTEKRAQTVQNNNNKTDESDYTFSAFRDVWIVFRHSCLKYVRVVRRCAFLRVRGVTCVLRRGGFLMRDTEAVSNVPIFRTTTTTRDLEEETTSRLKRKESARE